MVPPHVDPDTEPRFSIHRFVQRRLRFIAVVMPLACAVLLLPADGWLFELLRHFRLWNAVIGLAVGGLLLLLRDWKFAGIALVAGLWQGWPVWEYQNFPDGKQSIPDPGRSFTLLTCNLLYECREPERMIASLREANPDVLLLLEFTPELQHKLAADMWKDYPHRIEEPHTDAFGICLASKLPLADPKARRVAGGISVVSAVITVANERMALLGVHPPPPIRPEMYLDWRESFAAWPPLLRDTHADHRILAGDLNSTPFSRTFSRLCEETGLRDSAPGFGINNTWHLAGPLGLALDHVLISQALVVAGRTIGPDAGSDHRWVMVRLAPSH